MDKLREETRERTWEDYVETAGAVLAVGAGAAYFLKHGGKDYLNRAGEYITAARIAKAKGAFDDIRTWDKGISEVKQIANLGRGNLNLIDLSLDRGLQAIFFGHDIRVEGKAKSTYLRSVEQDFRLDYGNKLFKQMLGSSENHYIDEDSARSIENIFGKMLNTDESGDVLLSDASLRAELEKALGEGTSDDMMEEAFRFAKEVQDKMTSTDINQIVANRKVDWTFGVEKFEGFDPKTGKAIWNSTDIIDQVRESNPEEQVQNLANSAYDMLKHKQYQDELYSGITRPYADAIMGDRVTIADIREAIDRNEFDPQNFFKSRAFKRAGDKDAVFQNTWISLMEIRSELKADELDTFDKTIIAGLRRGEDGRIYSTAGIDTVTKTFKEALGDT